MTKRPTKLCVMCGRQRARLPYITTWPGLRDGDADVDAKAKRLRDSAVSTCELCQPEVEKLWYCALRITNPKSVMT